MTISSIASYHKIASIANIEDYIKEADRNIYRALRDRHNGYLKRAGYYKSVSIEDGGSLPSDFYKEDSVYISKEVCSMDKLEKLHKVEGKSNMIGYELMSDGTIKIHNPYELEFDSITLYYFKKISDTDVLLDDEFKRFYIDMAYQLYLHDCREDSDTEAIVFINQFIRNMVNEIHKQLGREDYPEDIQVQYSVKKFL